MQKTCSMKSNESLRGAANGKKWKRVIVTTRYKGKQKPGQSGSLQISDPRRTYVTPQFANLCPRLVDGLRDAERLSVASQLSMAQEAAEALSLSVATDPRVRSEGLGPRGMVDDLGAWRDGTHAARA